MMIASVYSASAGVATVKVEPTTFRRSELSVWSTRLRIERVIPAPPPALAYQPKYHTIAHTILERETLAATVPDEMFKLVDTLIDEAKQLGISGQLTDDAQIAVACGKIDNLLINHGFVYPPTGLTQLLSDGLTPKHVDAQELQSILNQFHNFRRRDFINHHPDGPFYYVDCDTASFLYLGIADELKLPLFLVEVPGHNFVRWYVSDSHYVDWETMDGSALDDNFYRQGFQIPAAQEQNGVFLSKMTPADVLGYCAFVVGGTFEQQKQWQKALDEYIICTQRYSRSPEGWNNAAWVLTSARDATIRNGQKAVTLALQAVALYPQANNLDTLGCAYAEAGDFDKAIEIESKAAQLDPTYEKTVVGFQAHKTWVEQNPEDPNILYVINAHR